MPRPQRVVTLREMRGSRPGRVLLATSDPAVVRAVERAMARRLDPAPMPPEPLSAVPALRWLRAKKNRPPQG